MRVFSSIALALALLAAPMAARANHWMQTADPQVLQALNELMMVYGNACQMGNPQACQVTQAIQQSGAMMLNAGHQCRTTGDPQACQFYNYAYGQLEQTYMATQQAMMAGQVQAAPQGYGAGTTHAQRMQQIHNWGQQRLDIGRQNQQILDNNHARFMEYLRN